MYDTVSFRLGLKFSIKNGATPQACTSNFVFSAVAPTASFATLASVDENQDPRSQTAPELSPPEEFGLPNGPEQADVGVLGMGVCGVLTGHVSFARDERWLLEVDMGVMEDNSPSRPENTEDIDRGRGTRKSVQRYCGDELPTMGVISVRFQHSEDFEGRSPGSAILVREVGRPAVPEPNGGL